MITPKIKLLFTCPHGGEEELDVLRDRKNLPPTCDDQFVTNRERNTRELTESICNKIETESTEKTFMIMASHHRKYVDFNREESCAFEITSAQAKDKYKAYHDEISLKINEMFSQDGKGLAFLFDIHGFDQHTQDGISFDVIIGNDQGRSIQALNNFDPRAYWGDNGLIPLLKKGFIYIAKRSQ